MDRYLVHSFCDCWESVILAYAVVYLLMLECIVFYYLFSWLCPR